MKKNLLIGSVVAALWLGFPHNSDADPLPIQPVTWGILADGGGRGPIDGVADYININRTIITGYSDTNPQIFHGLIEFDLLDYPLVGSDVFFNFSIFQTTGPIPPETLPFQLYGYIGDGQITHDDFSAGTLLFDFTLSSKGKRSLDVSSFVNSALTNGDRYIGLNIRPNGDPFVNGTVYWLRAPSIGPDSSVFLPEPHTVSLFALGILLTARLRTFRVQQMS